MEILNVFLALFLAAGSFIAGKTISDTYHREYTIREKEALERQYLRLRTRMDADDPVKPYVAPSPARFIPPQNAFPDELLTQFDKKMRTNGQATAILNNNKGTGRRRS